MDALNALVYDEDSETWSALNLNELRSRQVTEIVIMNKTILIMITKVLTFFKITSGT